VAAEKQPFIAKLVREKPMKNLQAVFVKLLLRNNIEEQCKNTVVFVVLIGFQ
jgi:hypothetical protein